MKQQRLDHYILLCVCKDKTDIINLFQIANKFSKANDKQFWIFGRYSNTDYADKCKDIIIYFFLFCRRHVFERPIHKVYFCQFHDDSFYSSIILRGDGKLVIFK